MKRFSAQYIFTNAGAPLKRGIITADDDGTITGVEHTGGDLAERESVEFHNGIIIPGFVNCHCHLELSHMKDLIPPGNGLAEFLKYFHMKREEGTESMIAALTAADKNMSDEGIVLCADICNTRSTFDLKKKSRIRYINLLEVFGIDPDRADRRMNEILQLYSIAGDYRIPSWLVPHTVYSLSRSLFSLLRTVTASNKITSVHFMETEAEKIFLETQTGPLRDSYNESGLGIRALEPVMDHASAVLEEITPSGNLILVHNTFTDRATIRKVEKRKNLFWCLCPNANLYIENHLPPVDLLIDEECIIVTGTDSLASNKKLSILEELKTLQKAFPSLKVTDLVRWATLNGAIALGEDSWCGSIQPGKKPGLLLLQNIDLQKMMLLSESFVTRLL